MLGQQVQQGWMVCVVFVDQADYLVQLAQLARLDHLDQL